MKIIISPAKIIKENNDDLFSLTKPKYLNQTKELIDKIKSFKLNDYPKLFNCSEDLAAKAYNSYQKFNLEGTTPAIFLYQGIQYQAFAASTLTFEDAEYLKNHLYILSALYGMLKPYDAICEYRLDFDNNPFDFDLYSFWNHQIYDELFNKHDIVINLASNEYAKMVRPYLKDDDTFIDVLFYTKKNNKLKEVSVTCKKARGLLAKYLTKLKSTNPTDMKNFNELGFYFCEELSTPNRYVFINE